MKKHKEHKPTIETLINTAAIALTTFGVNAIIQSNSKGYIAVVFGMGLEYLKYLGRHKKLW